MKFPVVFVNFKLFEQGVGKKAVEMAKICKQVSDETGVTVAIAVNSLDLDDVIEAVDLPVFAQHVDAVSYGSHTGHILPSLLKRIGVYGVLLNHAEDRIDDEMLAKTIELVREEGLYTLVCTESESSNEEFKNFDADLYAVESSKLIGTDNSISKEDPELIEHCANYYAPKNILVGGGVKTQEDVKIAFSLGAKGVLVASAVVKSDDPYQSLKVLCMGFKS